MVPVLVLFLIAVIVAVVVIVRRDHRRRDVAATRAASLGYRFDPASKPPPPLGFALLGIGSSRQVSYHTWRDGSLDSVFHYRHTTGTGDNRTIHHRSAAVVAVPFDAPHLQIGRDGFWASLGRVLGIRDIEVESPEFNDRFRVRCPDERFAITLLDPTLIGWLLSPASGGGQITYELRGPWMLCFGDRIDDEQLISFLTWAQGVRDALPAVLSSLYPAPPPIH
jgi:hypothetical protein